MPLALATLLAPLLAALTAGSPPRPSLTVRLVRPDRSLERVLGLFEGTRASSPAAALAAYGRARGGKSGLSKAAESGIVVFNPMMVGELAVLDGATFEVGRSPGGRLGWDLVIPRDDGTFAALATAMALTQGRSDLPVDQVSTDRLGPGGSAVSARAPGGFVVAASRADLAAGIARSRAPLDPYPPGDARLVVRVDPAALAAPGGTLAARRAGEALLGLGYDGLAASVAIEGDALVATVHGRGPAPGPSRAAIAPGWLDPVPAEGTIAAFALAIDPSPTAWDLAFAVLDRVERADRARAGAAPLRARLALLAGAAGVRPDRDLFAILVGVSGIVTVDGSGRVDGILVRLHARDGDAAGRLRDATVPRLVRSLRLEADPPRPGAGPDGSLRFRAGGRPIAVDRRGDAVDFAWGPSVGARAAVAAADPSRSAGPALRAGLPAGSDRFVAVWPGRLKALDLPDAPPAVWSGRGPAGESVDEVRWPGLRASVRRFVDRLPLDPPPDRSGP